MRFCGNCGTQLEENVHFCPNCGAPVTEEKIQSKVGAQPETQAVEPVTVHTAQKNAADAAAAQPTPTHATAVPPKTNGFAIAGFVLGICSVLFGWICCFNITSVLGLVFSIIGLCQTAGKKNSGKGLAIAGLVLSILAVLILVVFGLLTQAFEVYFSPNTGEIYRFYDGILSQI